MKFYYYDIFIKESILPYKYALIVENGNKPKCSGCYTTKEAAEKALITERKRLGQQLRELGDNVDERLYTSILDIYNKTKIVEIGEERKPCRGEK